MTKPDILTTIKSFTSIEQALDYFEIGYNSQFINTNREELVKRFGGYLIMEKPDDWFSRSSCTKERILPCTTLFIRQIYTAGLSWLHKLSASLIIKLKPITMVRNGLQVQYVILIRLMIPSWLNVIFSLLCYFFFFTLPCTALNLGFDLQIT